MSTERDRRCWICQLHIGNPPDREPTQYLQIHQGVSSTSPLSSLMSPLPNPTAAAATPHRTWASILGQALLWLALFLSFFKLPAFMSSDLDPSWRMAIGYMVGHDIQWGTDVVFTYGPLGYLLAATNHGEHYLHCLIWQFFCCALFATTAWGLGRRFHGWKAIVFYAYFLTLVASYIDAMYVTTVLLLALQILREPANCRRWLTLCMTAVLAVLSLVKFTNLMLAGFGIACIIIHHAWRRRWLDGVVAGGSFALWFIIGWLACGQHPSNIPAYLFTSLAASSGYTDAMSLDESSFILGCGLATSMGLIAYYLLSLWRRRDLPFALAATAICAATSFLNWKHGYSRADAHVLAHFVACLLIVVTHPLLLDNHGPFEKLKTGLLWFVGAVCMVGIGSVSPTSLTDAPAIINYNIKASVTALGQLPNLEREAVASFEKTCPAHALPRIREIVGNDTVDMIANSQAYIFFNRLNYSPRPLFQSYLPYTERLMQLNERFLQSARAPKYLLLKIDSIDQRLPALEDSLSLREMLYRYRFVTQEQDWLLWRRAESNEPVDPPTLIQNTKAAFGAEITVPEETENPVWMEIDIQPSLLGRLRGFLYKLPIVNIGITEPNGFRSSYRLIPSMARAGCFIYPHLTSSFNVRQYACGGPAPRVKSLSINVPKSLRKYYKSEIAVQFYRMPKVPVSTNVLTSYEVSYRMFDRAPISATAYFPLAAVQIDGREVLSANAPSQLEFLVDFPASRVRGCFGIADGAYLPPSATDGADFIVEWIKPDGSKSILFSRKLRPMTNREDRGIQSFELPLTPGGGRLFLRITPGPSNDASYDWTYWTDVQFLP